MRANDATRAHPELPRRAFLRVGALGLTADDSFEAVIREYVRENPDAVKLPGVA